MHDVLGEVEIQSTQRPLAVRVPRGHRRRTADFVGGVVAMLLLPLSIVPVLLLGPSVLRAPVALGHEGWGEVQRLERYLQPGRVHHHPGLTASELSKLPLVSLGPVYGRWTTFPQTGRLRPGNSLLGPEDRAQ